MRYVIIACLDRQIGAFMPPQAINDMLDEDIVESNRRAVVNGTIPEAKAQKLSLYKIGVFNDADGSTILEKEPKLLCNLGQFVPRQTIEEVPTDGKEIPKV